MYDPFALRPLGNQVLVEVLPEELTRDSGLVIPEVVAHPSCQGRIVAVGSRVSPDLMPGDHVIFEPYQENQIIPDSGNPAEEWLLVDAGTILCVVEP